jgi:hypothetical protein
VINTLMIGTASVDAMVAVGNVEGGGRGTVVVICRSWGQLGLMLLMELESARFSFKVVRLGSREGSLSGRQNAGYSVRNTGVEWI